MKIFLTFFVILVLSSCLNRSIVPIKEEDYTPEISQDIFCIYSKRPYGIPQIGSYEGYDYHIKNTREVLVYARYHKWEYKIVDQFEITKSEYNQLDSLFHEVEFFKYPKYIPHHDAEYLWPNDQYIIGFKDSKDNDLKMVYVDTIRAAKKYYPAGFFKLNDAIQKIIFTYSSWKR